ncbi:MAG: hypothetical protein NC412_04090 [Roseburia sp.]|nr:hypothetical protein [Roseburia sp.]MCM1278244.1 hypothetical protein [Robinsoniella sp.]
MKNDNSLFYTCSLIEYIGRQQKQKRSVVVEYLGKDLIKRIYNYADVFHCEPIEKVADDFICKTNIPMGEFDNVGKCKYEVPDYWTIGEVYERLIEDMAENSDKNIIEWIMEIYLSWIDDVISNYNTDFYYQSREYIYECYKAGRICA